MIKFVSGDFFDFDADIMVNTVNCVGVMGKGVALSFKNRFPDMFEDYAKKCRAGIIRPGQPSVWIQSDMISKEVEIVNFPTKDHWRDPSEYSYIDDGLRWFSEYLEDKNGKTVTLPALGCGNGGLDWNRVRPMIYDRLKNSTAEIYVFEPPDSIVAGDKGVGRIDYDPLLASVNCGVVKSTSNAYPRNLKEYTKKDLYFFPKEGALFEFDCSLVCSSKPDGKEIVAVRDFIELCLRDKNSVLLGASAFEKRIAIEFSARGLTCGCVLPSGIYESAKKIAATMSVETPHLISIGNPLTAFDRMEFMPSVLVRAYLAKKVVLFAKKLAWVKKSKKHFARASVDTYYFDSGDNSPEDVEAVSYIGAKKLYLTPV